MSDCFSPFECGAGWHGICASAVREIARVCSDIKILQVKEKFGGLRIYVSQYTPEVDEIIRVAEVEALKTCEACGSMDGVETRNVWGWICTLCNSCAKKREENISTEDK